MDEKEFNQIKYKDNKNEREFTSTRWVLLQRHQWIIETTDNVIK